MNLLGNSIVLIAPKDSKIDTVAIGQGFDLATLAGDGKIATGDVKSVPVGKYAKAALEKLGSWSAAEPKFAMAESVRAALLLVSRGEAALGIVYATDAKVDPGVKVIGTFPADSHPAIIYPVAATTTAKPEANDYLAFLRSAAAKTVLEKYGFTFLFSSLQHGRPHPESDRRRLRRPDRVSKDGMTISWFETTPRGVSHHEYDARLDNMSHITPEEWTAIALSLRVALVATLVATPLGIALAWLLARRDFWGKGLIDALVHLPLVLPPVVTGYLLLLTFGRRGAVGAWLADNLGIVFAFKWTGAALACGVMSFPLLVRPIRLSIEAVDRKLEQAASTLGAAPWRVFWTITLPLALPGVLAGMVLGFAKAIGEFGATITFVSNIPGETQTISAAIYSLIQTPDGDTAALRLVIVSVVIAMVALVMSEWLARRATLRLHGN